MATITKIIEKSLIFLSFLGKIVKRGHTLLSAKHNCGSTKEECPP
jgi:hypothetical protein